LPFWALGALLTSLFIWFVYYSDRAGQLEPKKMNNNSLKKIRESFLISKTELARRANISLYTISRIEQGMKCRIKTKRKILLALGLKLTDRDKVFH
jgi:DNA-binding XRE family transcriptional regulator